MEVPTLGKAPSPITHATEKRRDVFYGEAGVGKTTLAMSYPRPFVINTDGGLVAVTANDPDAVLGEQVEVSGYQDLTALYFYLKDHADEFDTIIIDSLDELAFILTDELIARHAEYDRRKKGSAYDPHPVFEQIPEQAEYQANQRQLHRFLVELRRLNKHVVVLLGVRDADPPKQKKRVPNLAPGAVRDLVRWSSVTGELVIADGTDGKEHRYLLTKNGDPVRESKTRFAGLSPYVEDPTFDVLQEKN